MADGRNIVHYFVLNLLCLHNIQLHFLLYIMRIRNIK